MAAMHLHTKAPRVWEAIGPEQSSRRGRLSSDLCVIDSEQFFVKGLIELKLIGTNTPVVWRTFCWTKVVVSLALPQVFGVWAQVTQQVFNHILANWKADAREKHPNSKALCHLASSLPTYAADTLGLQLMLHVREKGKRPLLTVEPSDHPLASEQIIGVSPARVAQLNQHTRGAL
jgi:hypothetical protein